jgi:hypothetical protein
MRHFIAMIALAIATAGCSFDTGIDIPDVPGLGSGTPEAAEAGPQPERIDTIERIDVGQAARGVIVDAAGYALLPGYYRPELRLIDGGRPAADGMIELEFVAIAPATVDTAAPGTETRRLIAAQFLPSELIRGARGVRVLAVGNMAEHPF